MPIIWEGGDGRLVHVVGRQLPEAIGSTTGLRDQVIVVLGSKARPSDRGRRDQVIGDNPKSPQEGKGQKPATRRAYEGIGPWARRNDRARPSDRANAEVNQLISAASRLLAGDQHRVFRYRRLRAAKRHAASVELDAGGAVLRMHRLERLFEGRPEVPQPGVVRSELRL